jgi:hypothetical protein
MGIPAVVLGENSDFTGKMPVPLVIMRIAGSPQERRHPRCRMPETVKRAELH